MNLHHNEPKPYIQIAKPVKTEVRRMWAGRKRSSKFESGDVMCCFRAKCCAKSAVGANLTNYCGWGAIFPSGVASD